jgi:serine/threonine protein kinase
MNAESPDSTGPLEALSPPLNELCDRFEVALKAAGPHGPRPRIEDYLADVPEAERSTLLRELITLEVAYRRGWGEDPRAEQYQQRFALLDPARLAYALAARPASDRDRSPGLTPTGNGASQPETPRLVQGRRIRCPHCHNPIQLADERSDEVLCPGCGGSFRVRESRATETSARMRPLGKFQLLERVGLGAFGAVWKARDTELDRVVALKIPHTGLLIEEHDLERFHREARAAAQLRHPHIATVHDVVTLEGLPTIVADFIHGVTLKDFLGVRRLTFREAAALVADLAKALDYAHARGLVHRDVKPSNIMLEYGPPLPPDPSAGGAGVGREGAGVGKPVLMDFGLALRGDVDVTLTQDGCVIGTPAYLSPEQAAGQSHQADRRSDVYSLGVVLYELLTGEVPFRGSKIMILHQVLHEEPRPPRKLNDRVPRDLETICLKSLQKDRSKRYASAADLAEDLRRFLAGEPIQARPVGPTERLWRWCKRNPRVAALSAVAAALIVGWAVSASALALGLKLQTDEAHKQTAIAQENERKAKDNEEKANNSADEARTQKGIAETQRGIAEENEKRAKDTAERTVEQMVNFGSNLHSRLDGTLLAPLPAPELRHQLLAQLRRSLFLLSQTIEGQGTTRYGTSRVCIALGDLLLGAGQSEEATKMYQQGYAAMKKLAQTEPDDNQTQANFAMTIVRLGDVPLVVNGDPRDALRLYTRAREVDMAVLQRPGRRREEWRSKLDVSHTDVRMAWALLALGQPAEGRKYLEEARVHRQFWRDLDPQSWEPSNYLMEVRLWLGVSGAHLGDEKAAREHFAEALRLGEDLMKRHPDVPRFKGDMAEVQGAYGDALLRWGQVTDAQKSYEESLRNLQIKIASDPDDIKLQPFLALAHERLATANVAQGKRPDAKQHYQEALRLRKALWQIEPTNLVREAAYILALARCGQPDQAAAGAAKLLQRAGNKTALLLDVARCYAACAAADGPKKGEYSEQAVAVLKAVVDQRDYKDAFALATDPDLAAVRAAPAFQALVAEVKGR